MKPSYLVSKFVPIAALVLYWSDVSSVAAANLVINGGFETGNLVSGWNQNPNQLGVVIDLNAPVGINGGGASYVHSGTHGLAAGPSSLRFLSQTLATTVGESYDLSFWLFNQQQGTTNSPTFFGVSWNGGANLVSLSNTAAFAFTQYSFTGLVATSTSTTLQFSFMHNPSYWGLDDVSVVVSGPAANNTPDGGASAGLLGLALAAIVSARRWLG